MLENYIGELTDDIYKIFINIALESYDKNTIKYLLGLKSNSTIKELFNEYMYVILLCGSGDNKKLEKYLHILMEIGDECLQTAYLCGNFDTVRYLVNKEIRIQNCFLKEKILCDQFIWERYNKEHIRFYNVCSKCT
jgi:hypothetical protein